MEKFVSFIILLLAAVLLAPGCMAEQSTTVDIAQASGVLETVKESGTTNVANTSETVDKLAGNGSPVADGASAPLTADVNTTNLTAKLNGTILISLKENPTTGFVWNVTNSSGLEIVSDEYVVDKASEGMEGAGGVHEWMVKAVEIGNQTFDAIYKRSWEPITGEEDTYTLKVVVEETAKEPVNETPLENPVAKNSVI